VSHRFGGFAQPGHQAGALSKNGPHDANSGPGQKQLFGVAEARVGGEGMAAPLGAPDQSEGKGKRMPSGRCGPWPWRGKDWVSGQLGAKSEPIHRMRHVDPSGNWEQSWSQPGAKQAAPTGNWRQSGMRPTGKRKVKLLAWHHSTRGESGNRTFGKGEGGPQRWRKRRIWETESKVETILGEGKMRPLGD